ncbi:MAG: virulence RhuM family protein [Victivallales bacterium]|nr:virulence RhuM family protein [Victivallales bacterium]
MLIFESEDGKFHIEVRFEDETVWLTQALIVQLFDSSKANISEHIANIFASGELSPEATVRKFRTVQQEGTRMVERERDFYNLDVIISVGYRVNSRRATQFRQWATK